MPKSVIEMALANIDGQIADLQRAKELIVAASGADDLVRVEPKKRGRKRKGLPTDTPSNGE